MSRRPQQTARTNPLTNFRGITDRIRRRAEQSHQQQFARMQQQQRRQQVRRTQQGYKGFILQVNQYQAASGLPGTSGAPTTPGQAIGTMLATQPKPRAHAETTLTPSGQGMVVASISLDPKKQAQHYELDFILTFAGALNEIKRMLVPALGPTTYPFFGAGFGGPAGTELPVLISNDEAYIREAARQEGLRFMQMQHFSSELERWQTLPPLGSARTDPIWSAWPP